MSDDLALPGAHEVLLDPPASPGKLPGLVVKWRRRGGVVEGLVTREEAGRIVTEWVPMPALEPLGPVGDENLEL